MWCTFLGGFIGDIVEYTFKSLRLYGKHLCRGVILGWEHFYSEDSKDIIISRNLKFLGYYGFGLKQVSAAAGARQDLSFT